MKSFQMKLPSTVAEAVKMLPSEEGDRSAVLLAGGQDLLSELKEHLVEPDTLVNLKAVPGLDGIAFADDGGLTLGALVTVQDIERDGRIQESLPMLAEAAASVGSPQIRAFGTLGGNLNQRPRCWYYRSEHAPCLKKGGDECFSYYGRNKYNAILGGGPSYIVHPSDLAPALVALDAVALISGPQGERRLPLGEYYTLPDEGDILSETRLAPGEILTHLLVPPPPAGQRSTYLKFQERGSYDFALAAVALGLVVEGDTIRRARLVLGAVAPKPWRCERTERKLAGRPVDDETLRLAAEDALADARPLSDNGYKVPLTKGLIVRAFERLV